MLSVEALSFLTKIFPFTLPDDNSRKKEHFRKMKGNKKVYLLIIEETPEFFPLKRIW